MGTKQARGPGDEVGFRALPCQGATSAGCRLHDSAECKAMVWLVLLQQLGSATQQILLRLCSFRGPDYLKLVNSCHKEITALSQLLHAYRKYTAVVLLRNKSALCWCDSELRKLYRRMLTTRPNPKRSSVHL